MSERKGIGNRGSLMDLIKPRLAQAALSTPLDEAERRILTGAPQAEAPAPPIASQPVEIAVPEPPAAQPGDQPAPAPPKAAASETRPPRGRETRRATVDDDDVLARLRKNRQPIAVVGFKLPAALKDELAAVAQYNGTDMTRIVVEALSRLLPDLPHPPGWR